MTVRSDGPNEVDMKPIREDVLKDVLKRFDGDIKMTMPEAYGKSPQISWTEFLNAVNLLISEGFLVGKGDGFVVQYLLTTKGRNAIDHNGGGSPFMSLYRPLESGRTE
jgi:hypothetical protein